MCPLFFYAYFFYDFRVRMTKIFGYYRASHTQSDDGREARTTPPTNFYFVSFSPTPSIIHLLETRSRAPQRPRVVSS